MWGEIVGERLSWFAAGIHAGAPLHRPSMPVRILIMTKKFQEQLQSLLAQIDIGHDSDIQVKPFFGGAAAYLYNLSCVKCENARQSKCQEMMG